MERTGQLAYAAGVAGLGMIVLITGDLGSVFQPVAAWIPAPTLLGYASAGVLLIGGLALVVREARPVAALAVTANFAIWLLLLNLPNTATAPKEIGNWEACGLNMTVLAGGWLFLTAPWAQRRAGLARRVFALGLPLVGLAHLLGGPEAAAQYVPACFPVRVGWVYFTGVAHIAAGLAIFFRVLPVLAAVLEAAQITSFVLIAHLPLVWGAPRDLGQWAQLIYAVAIAGAAWLVAATQRKATPSTLFRAS